MADPFGISASVITSLQLAKTLHSLIVKLKNTPAELLALSNEVCNLKFVLDAIQEVVQERCEEGLQSFDRLGPILFQLRVKFEQLDIMLARWIKLDQWGETQPKTFERVMWLKERSKVWDLQRQFRELRLNLSILLEANNFTTRLSIEIKDLYAKTTKTYDSQNATLDTISSRIESLGEIHRESQESVQLLQDLHGSVNRLLEQQSLMSQRRTVDKGLGASVEERSSSKPSKRQVTFSDPLEDPSPVYTEFPDQDDVPVTVSVQQESVNKPACWSGCQCCCHTRRRIRAMPMLERFAGRLMFGYSGPSLFRQQCDLDTCEQRESPNRRLTYFFPQWFASTALSVCLTDNFGSPSLNIKVRKSVSETNRLFALSRFEGADEIRKLFAARAASPDDIDPRGGWTPLHFAVCHGCVEVVKLLLSSGADPHWEDNTGTSPAEDAWRSILQLRVPAPLREQYAVLFPGTEYLEERQFNRLHNLIIGLEKGDLEIEAIKLNHLVNGLDLDGWTPLHWAARRGDGAAVSILLENGADPFIKTGNESRGVLQLAGMSNSALCVKLLLDYRKVNAVLDINEQDGLGCTPLRVAAEYNSLASASYLIKAGADLNKSDNFGETPLLSAMAENRHETANVLLRAGADYTIKTHAGNGVLHLVANVGDVQMLRVLKKAHLQGIDLEARNSDGNTATEKVEVREEAPVGFKNAFETLVQCIEDGDFDNESWATSSMGESWHSFEETSWWEAEALVHED
ncbi:MAG: hypothetical protein M1822_002343 [Bathelium mastoideum]|nr:MAG: hypothetical protein M1822_002343 [Bathelium mastoideum]